MKRFYSSLALTFILFFSHSLFSQSCSDGSYSWDDDIAAILAPCMGCHGGTGGLTLTTYAGISAGGNDCSNLLTGSTFVTKITTGGCGGGAMNNNCGGCIDAAELTAIQTWIDNGAQESCPVVVPVVYLDFSLRTFQNHIQISWSTSSEVNSDFYEIYHSEDGVDFDPIAVVNAAGNSNVIKDYSNQHFVESDGQHFYKILQTDFNGNQQWTDIISTRFSSTILKDDYSFYPNPTNGLLNLVVEKNLKNYQSVMIFNAQGKLLKKQKLNDNYPTTELDIHEFNSGIYFLSLEGLNSKSEPQRFVKI